MKGKKLLKALGIGALCLAGGLMFSGCNKTNNNTQESVNDSQIRAVYALAQENGYTGTYEEWLNSIKGEKGEKGATGDNIELRVYGGYIQWKTTSSSTWENLISVASLKGEQGASPIVEISNDGYWVINGEKTEFVAIGQDVTYSRYTINYDYGIAENFFNEYDEDSQTIKTTDTVKSTEWITSIPTIKNEYKESFLGWFIEGTDIQIKNYSFIGGDCVLEARFDINTLGLSGLYQNGKYVKTWEDLKAEYPNAFDGSTIISKDNHASYFASCCGELVIGNEITSIGEYAFSVCRNLTSITIPDSVTSIGSDAFRDCTGLTSITIPNSVTSIGSYTFIRCTGLTSIIIPNSVTSIGDYAFSDCRGLTSIIIPNSVTSIGDYAFSDCRGLTSITIPNSVTRIGSYAFKYCTGLTSIIIPNSVTNIGQDAFYYCASLTSIIVDSENPVYDSRENCNAIIKTVTNELISGCKNSTIPNSVTRIGSGAFSGCTGLTSITIPNSVTSIGYSAFYNCTSLTSITIPNSVTSIGDYTFDGCRGLTSITIPNSVTSIGWYAFYGCTGLTSITIPNSVTSIGSRAFSDCTGLTSITIPNSVTSIGDRAFYNCVSLTSITIPSSVTRIGDQAFYNCTGLTSITIPNSVTLIEDSAFKYCKSLKLIIIDSEDIAGLDSSDSYLFDYADTVYVKNSISSVGEYITDSFELATNDFPEYNKYVRKS